MAVEAKRGCGYRKIGALYLVSGGEGYPCDRLPILLDICPVCSHGIKQTRGWTWVDVNGLVGGVHKDCKDNFPCPLCMATSEMGKAGLLWVGEKFYKTPAEFNHEAATLGISKRIRVIPREFKLGTTWILLAHPKAIVEQTVQLESTATVTVESPGIFKVWRPTIIEKIVPESKRDSEEVAELIKRGITPIFVPDNDPDHQPSTHKAQPVPGGSNDRPREAVVSH